MSNEYDDIINLPHHVSKRHPQMSMWNRAAQFAPFAAVVGHEAAIRETGRVTEDRIDIEETGYEELNRKLNGILSHLSEHPTVTIDYFLPDEHKAGGSYQQFTGQVKMVDEYEHVIVMMDGTKILLKNILEIWE